MRISDWSSDVCSPDLYAIYNVQQRLDQTRRDLADTVVQLSTVDPDRSYGGKIVLAKIMDKKLPKIVTINLDWNGERYPFRSEEHKSELQSLMRISYAVFCLKKNNN